jgi:hypothetical protein
MHVGSSRGLTGQHDALSPLARNAYLSASRRRPGRADFNLAHVAGSQPLTVSRSHGAMMALRFDVEFHEVNAAGVGRHKRGV